ncbi:MAG: right-handed parallel beta-helix repeat-containing protein [Acidobacteriota bacterium]
MHAPRGVLLPWIMSMILMAVAGVAQAGGGFHDVIQFGAVANDGLDDRVAIQAAVDAACVDVAAGTPDVTVVFPAGVYDVEKGPEPAPSLPWVIVELPCGGFTLAGAPNGDTPGGLSTIRVADNQGEYESVFGSPTFAQSVDGLRFVDLTLDGNGANNRITTGDAAFDDVLRNRRYGIRVYAGSDIHVERSRFTDWHTVNVIVLNGVDVANVTVTDSRFDTIGDASPIGPDWDHSSIYTDSDGAILTDNVFTSVGVGAFGVRTAIETHGPNQIVRGNRIEAFTTGMNATGVSVLGSDLQIVEDNDFLDVADGIRIWAFEVPGNPPGEPVLRDLAIRRNTITLNVDGWRITQDPFEQSPRGIELIGDSDGVIENLVIDDNTIGFINFGAQPRDYDRWSAGIRLVPDIVTDLPIRGLTIQGNTITNALATAIVIGSPLPNGALLQNNRILDAGAGQPSIPDGLRSGILFFGDYRNVEIRENCVLATTTPTIAQAIYLFGDSGTGNRILRSDVENQSGSSIDYVRIEDPLGLPWQIDPPRDRCTTLLFRDGFESTDTSAWSATID